eukprot:UN01086
MYTNILIIYHQDDIYTQLFNNKVFLI